MDEPILHHYPQSPFSEKVRLAFGAKRMAWRSVHIPVMLPKPDVLALTGGYRKTPILQVGADVYCDSALICRWVEAQASEPTLYPAAQAALSEMLAQWADSTLFWTAVPFTTRSPGAMAALFPGAAAETFKAFGADRAAFAPHVPRLALHDGDVALGHYLGWLESLLADGRAWIAGDALSIADLSVAHPLWFMRQGGIGARLDARPRLAAWLERVLALGHGSSTPTTSDAAVALAASTHVHAPTRVEPGLGFEAGEPVTVAATDYGSDPVHGTLVGLGAHRVTLERRDPRAGTVHVHFPRIGFGIRKETST
ncbi:MAG TPA: glutathione S-transferase family protein [Ideonella sp.]|nr:glutathione S-transferase family protein [Ideonella sp.]